MENKEKEQVVVVEVPKDNKLKVSGKSIASIVVALVGLFNSIAPTFGLELFPFSNDEVFLAVSTLVTVGGTLWAWFRQNAVTKYGLEKQAIATEILGTRKEFKEREEGK